MFFKSKIILDSNENMAVLDADQDEFLSICSFLKNHARMYSANGALPFEKIYDTMLESGIIPCITRGADTEPLFKKYSISDKFIAVMLAEPEHMVELFQQSGGQVEQII